MLSLASSYAATITKMVLVITLLYIEFFFFSFSFSSYRNMNYYRKDVCESMCEHVRETAMMVNNNKYSCYTITVKKKGKIKTTL